MSQNLNVLIHLLAYSDAVSNDPKLRDLDYARQFIGVETKNSYDRRFSIAPKSSLEVVTLARPLTQDATTQYQVYLYNGNTFRWVYKGGTNPNLKNQRTLTYDATTEFDITKTGDVVKYKWNGIGANPDFITNGVTEGDILHIEANGNFNILNEGDFIIVGVEADYLEVINSKGVAETGIAVGGNINGIYLPIDIYASSGVQVGDQVKIIAPLFNIENQGIFTITGVTSQYFEFNNGNPGIPEGPFSIGADNNIIFFPSIYKWCYIESDQKISVRVNADTSDNIEIEPLTLADNSNIGVYLQRGGIWKLVLANNGNNIANIKVVLME